MRSIQTRGGKLSMAAYALLAVVKSIQTISEGSYLGFNALTAVTCFVLLAFQLRSGVYATDAGIEVRRFRTRTIPFSDDPHVVMVPSRWFGSRLTVVDNKGTSLTTDITLPTGDDQLADIAPPWLVSLARGR